MGQYDDMILVDKKRRNASQIGEYKDGDYQYKTSAQMRHESKESNERKESMYNNKYKS